jgi:ariadne-1
MRKILISFWGHPSILVPRAVLISGCLYILLVQYFNEFLSSLLIFCLQTNQKDLELSTEQLSEYLERDITSDMLVDIKQKVQDKYR